MNISERFDKPTAARRILLIQLGDIGDVVWFLPALRAVREAFPSSSVAVLLRGGNGVLLAAEDSPPAIFEVRKGLGESLRLIRALRRERFEVVFDLRGDERGAYTAFLTGAPIRAALHYPSLSRLRRRLFTHLVLPSVVSAAAGAADPSLLFLKAFGIDARTAVPELDLSSEVKYQARKILADEGISPAVDVPAGGEGRPGTGMSAAESWITINPFSRWSYKEWGVEKWARVMDWLRRDFGIASVIVGAPAERKRANELAGACAGGVINLAGRTSLEELAGVLHFSRLHIGVDSAAPHIAAAVGTPTVTLYGPSDWRYWKPQGDKHRVAFSNMECVPCHQKGCEGSGISRCLDTLEVGRVQEVIHAALKELGAVSPRRSA